MHSVMDDGPGGEWTYVFPKRWSENIIACATACVPVGNITK